MFFCPPVYGLHTWFFTTFRPKVFFPPVYGLHTLCFNTFRQSFSVLQSTGFTLDASLPFVKGFLSSSLRASHLMFYYLSSKVFLSSSLRVSHLMFHYLSSKVFLSPSLRASHLIFTTFRQRFLCTSVYGLHTWCLRWTSSTLCTPWKVLVYIYIRIYWFVYTYVWLIFVGSRIFFTYRDKHP